MLNICVYYKKKQLWCKLSILYNTILMSVFILMKTFDKMWCTFCGAILGFNSIQFIY